LAFLGLSAPGAMMRFDESSHKLVICHHSSSFLIIRGAPRSSFLIIRPARRARSATTPMTALEQRAACANMFQIHVSKERPSSR
jgi:hypothetical protein